MQEYCYSFNEQNYEIFPSGVVNDPYVVFHGTSDFYSDRIEVNGFQRNYSPFDEEAVLDLAILLESENFKNYDQIDIASSLRHYLYNDMRLSFTCLSGAAIKFATGLRKGGQIIGKIRNAQAVLNEAISENHLLHDELTQPLQNLFDLCRQIGNASGVVYAVRLSNGLNGISHQNYVIYSENSLPASSIIGKVVLPDTSEEFNETTVLRHNKNKLFKGIGRILHNKEEEE